MKGDSRKKRVRCTFGDAKRLKLEARGLFSYACKGYEREAGELLLRLFESNRFVIPTRRGRFLGGIMIGVSRRTRG